MVGIGLFISPGSLAKTCPVQNSDILSNIIPLGYTLSRLIWSSREGSCFFFFLLNNFSNCCKYLCMSFISRTSSLQGKLWAQRNWWLCWYSMDTWCRALWHAMAQLFIQKQPPNLQLLWSHWQLWWYTMREYEIFRFFYLLWCFFGGLRFSCLFWSFGGFFFFLLNPGPSGPDSSSDFSLVLLPGS